MAPRRTAAQKAAEAAEAAQDAGTTSAVDDKGRPLTVQQLKNKLRNEAEREVLDTHKDEVIRITAAKYKEHNLEYVRRLTDKEKAQKQIEELYAQYPDLRPQLQQQQTQQEEREVAYAPSDYVQAVPGGALEQFREGGHEAPYVEPDYSEVEYRTGD